MFRYVNLLLAFLLEICLLIIFGYWGAAIGPSPELKIAFGAGLPVFVAVIWGIFLAPASKTRLRDPWLTAVKVFLFSLAVFALFFTGLKGAAIGFGLITLLNLILLYIYK